MKSMEVLRQLKNRLTNMIEYRIDSVPLHQTFLLKAIAER